MEKRDPILLTLNIFLGVSIVISLLFFDFHIPFAKLSLQGIEFHDPAYLAVSLQELYLYKKKKSMGHLLIGIVFTIFVIAQIYGDLA
ncbi:hypothetical protein BW727_101234 [Jeotgalibaca dankookensis]|uniref:Uncharacterized protein n=1 Tax=Jeotgalibaca dankookensis TaxID=708126 RepID=A0A1S6IPW5_9LACT|nr:hypothetical protein [Jeotgalibaca dankookensis]AQS53601.1 hypothetical protein BW727_101234 [Jeotgalibaca dankookensis]